MSKRKERCKIVSQRQIGTGIFDLWLQTEKIAKEAAPGQFVSLYSRDGSRMLPRPISLCEIDRENGQIRLVYRVAGAGTKEFSRLHPGVTLDVVGPLGNGFPVEEYRGKRVLLLGGGIGIPPLLETAKALAGKAAVAAGYRDELFLLSDLEKYAKVAVATEDGSAGIKGTVLDAVRAEELSADVIFSCGPTPMLRAVKEYALEKGIPCYLSMEERMACGIGACLACVCKSKEKDEHSQVFNKRICAEGPVFLSTEVEL